MRGEEGNILAVPRVDGTRFGSVDAFLHFLGELSLVDWLAIGSLPPVEPRIIAALRATLAHHHLQVDAWLLRDSVETIAFLVTDPRAMSRDERQALGRARKAAEDAAPAILAHDALAPGVRTALLSPFKA
jgi:hypothetical protein